jgi:hypothetical protein
MAAKPNKVRVYTVKPLSESELESGFAIADSHPFWKALMCFLASVREEQGALAATLNEQEKRGATSAAIGAHDILGQVIYDLDSKRKSALKKSSG